MASSRVESYNSPVIVVETVQLRAIGILIDMSVNQTMSGLQVMGAGAGFRQRMRETIAGMRLYCDLAWPGGQSLACFT